MNLISEVKEKKQDKKVKQPKQAKTRVKKVDPLEPLKLEIAAELGLLEQAKEQGWHSLSAREAGRIGGLMTQRRRKEGKARSDGLKSSDG